MRCGCPLGFREGQLLGLRWEDFDVEAETLSVRRSRRRKNRAHIQPPKNGKGRSIQADKNRRKSIQEPSTKGRNRERLGVLHGRIMSYSIAEGHPEREELDRATSSPSSNGPGLPDIGCAICVTCATLPGPGVHPKFVQELLGANLSITLGTYSRATEA